METRQAHALAEHFPAEAVKWRIGQGKATPGAKVTLVAYLDARLVQDRFDAVFGVDGWSFDWTPIHVDAKGELRSAKGTITACGITKSDIGTASTFEPSKGAVSDSFKRAAVMWGVGRYLYELPVVRCTLDGAGEISETFLCLLRVSLTNLATAKMLEAPTSTTGRVLITPAR